MAIISLRAYNREIEGMIDNRQLDEAVAHCRHILATFPKHIATYRLLGKTHLEQQRISDATDIFQRVLSAIPDDFVSNVGMSIIREDENNLDAAIWHMELAYEAQPANVAIQDELRRLYGRRDGMQPPRVRLTRGALARMYAKGGLFDQASAELRAAINEDPNRPDLQLLLAQMLYQTSQRVDAVDTCMNILKKMPLCLEANRILAVSLPDADNSEVVKNSRQLAISMDPYYAFAEPDAITSEGVPDNAVTIEKLEYKSGIQVGEVPEQPAWATSLGISMEKPAEENVPDWLKAVEAPSATSPADNAQSGISPFIWDTQEVENIITDTSQPEGEIPDWMKDAGWKPATAEAQSAPNEIPFSEELQDKAVVNEDLAQGDIPEWLRGIAPDGFMGTQGQQFQAEEDKLSNPWLEPHQPGPTDSIIQWLEEEKPVSPTTSSAQTEDIVLPTEDEIPDWMKDLDVPQTVEGEGTDISAPAAAFTTGLSDFLEETEQPQVHEVTPQPAEEQLQTDQPEIPVQETISPIPTSEEIETRATTTEDEVLPDWLKDVADEQTSPEMPQAFLAEATEGTSLVEQEVPPEETVSPTAEVTPEPAPPVESKHGEHLPEIAGAILAAEMISKATEQPKEDQADLTEMQVEAPPPPVVENADEEAQITQPPVTELGGPLVTEEVPPSELPIPAEAEIPAAEPEAFAWLKGLADEQDAQEEQIVASEPNPDLEPPEWVKLETEPEEQEAISAEPLAEVAPTPESETEVPEWIKGLGEETETGEPEEKPLTSEPSELSENAEEELPGWITEMEKPETEGEIVEGQEEPLEWEPEELPAWLKEITESEQAEEEPAPAESISTGEIAATAVAVSMLSKEESDQEGSEIEEPQELAPEIQASTIQVEETAPSIVPEVSEEQVTETDMLEAVPGEPAEITSIEPPKDVESDAEQVLQSALIEARNAINSGEPSQAVNYYTSLIKENYHLDDIIKDLQEALYRYPIDTDMWVTLGDAHSKTNDLQEALNAYSRAEELVR